MSDKTKIEWTEATWNPTTGCDKVSPGCKFCYAERDWARLSKNKETVYYGRSFNDVATHEDRLDTPLRWRRPRRIFVNSMSDLFHRDIPLSFIFQVWVTMALARANGHIFQILTKRADRMVEIVNALDKDLIEAICDSSGVRMPRWEWPLPNVWLGVSVEDQKRAEERIPFLLDTPAAVRFLSCEPLLDTLNIEYALSGQCSHPCDDYLDGEACKCLTKGQCMSKIDWVICGGESGPNARPMHQDWVRGLRDQCQGAGVPFHFKQWGEWYPVSQLEAEIDPAGKRSNADFWQWADHGHHQPSLSVKIGKKAAGRILDGRTWEEMPK